MFDRDLIPFLYGLNSTVMWISLTVGFLLLVIGYFAGGRMTFGRIVLCTFAVTLIGVLSLPAPMALFKVIKEQYQVETYFEKQPTSYAPEKNKNDTAPAATPSQVENRQGQQAAPTEEKNQVPISFQVLALVMHILWTAFLVAMGIFFYETLIVTAEEADKR